MTFNYCKTFIDDYGENPVVRIEIKYLPDYTTTERVHIYRAKYGTRAGFFTNIRGAAVDKFGVSNITNLKSFSLTEESAKQADEWINSMCSRADDINRSFSD